MSVRSYGIFLCLLISAFILCMEPAAIAEAAPESATGSGGYLSSYQEPAAQPQQSSWWSTLAYLFSLLVVFAFVVLVAYLASRFLGSKFGQINANKSSKILENLPLGTNRAISVVEIAGKVMVLGVTEHNITLLDEITDEIEIAKLHNNPDQQDGNESFPHIFEKQLHSLEQLSRKIPTLLNDKRARK